MYPFAGSMGDGERGSGALKARALAAQAGALVELLEGDLSEKGRYAGRKEQQQ